MESRRFPQLSHDLVLLLVFCRICFGSLTEGAAQCAWAADFDDGHGNVRLVDSFNGNLLLRSAWPEGIGIEFTHSELLGCLEAEMRRAAGDLWPEEPFELIDVALADEFLTQDAELFGPKNLLKYPSANSDFFDKRFEDACSQSQSKLGMPDSQCPASMQPQSTSPELRDLLATTFEEWEGDSLEDHVRTVRALLEKTGRRVIFFHCASGKDRTGEFFAAYAIRYMNMSFTKAWATNVQVARRMTIYNDQVAAQWYCEYLRKRGLYAFDDCGSCQEWPMDALDSLKQCAEAGQLEKETLNSGCQAQLDRFQQPLCTEDPPEQSIVAYRYRSLSYLVAVASVSFIVVLLMLLRRSRQTPSSYELMTADMIA